MTRIRAVSPSGLHVVLCVKFASDAPLRETIELKQALIEDERILHSLDMTGAFDFMSEAQPESLSVYKQMLDEFAGRFGHLVERFEASFICRRFLREGDGRQGYIWVHDSDGFKRLDHDQIDQVTAEGDYVRVHSNGGSWLLHETMKGLRQQLDDREFLQINRSLIVRSDFIERLMHDFRRWKVRLLDGTEHFIAKARSAHIIEQLRIESSNSGAASSIRFESNENPAQVTEKPMQADHASEIARQP